MRWKSKLFGATAAIMALPTLAHAEEAPIVSVPGGQIMGAMDKGSMRFQAIPYAAPPLGDLRWRPPAPVVPWQGIRDARLAGPPCLQNNVNWNRASWLRGNEDCLTVNVRTPAITGKLPVIVWIHGGGNHAGSAGGPIESDLVRHGAVVVSLQYRLGILGFLAHRKLAAEQGGTSGNYGLMDQIAALRWVRDNISRFGGDPAQVMIFGESAGSQDVSLLLAAPSARGLFRSAIMQSGTPGFGMSYRPLEQAFKIGDQLDELAGSGGDLGNLRSLSPVALFQLQSQLTEAESKGNNNMFLRTTIDGAVLPDSPNNLLAKAPPIPVIIGTDTAEFGPPPGGEDLGHLSRYWLGDNADAALAAYRAEDAKGADPRRGHIELRIQSDAEFHCPAYRFGDQLARQGWPVWRYEFDVGENGGRTRHAYELGFIFEAKPVGGGAKMQDYWAAFAVKGDPNAMLPSTAKRPRWEKYNLNKPALLKFGEANTTMIKGLPRQAYCGWSPHY